MSGRDTKLGIVGVGGRGGSFTLAVEHAADVTVHAVCDLDEEALANARGELDAAGVYTDYRSMLVDEDLDAVIVGTPMALHAEQAIAALERDVHVLSEVPAGVDVEECRDLVGAVEASDAEYMMAENYVYTKPNQLVGALVEAGEFGEVYYAEGEYIHELKALNERTPWRRKWQTGIDGVTYPTHSLGPILTWLPDDRVERVCCAGSGHHYTDPRDDEYEQQDTTVMLCETERDRLVEIRLDMLSERPHAVDNYQLQGTAGSYESARAGRYAPESTGGDTHKLWLESDEPGDDSHEYEWRPLAEYEEEYLPERWQNPPEPVQRAGHGGGDYFVVAEFLNAVVSGETPSIDVYRAMDMTLPGLASQESIERDGEWIDVPDPREW